MDAPLFHFNQVFYVSLYPDAAFDLLGNNPEILPMSEQVERLKLAEWIGFQTRAVLVEQIVFSRHSNSIFIVQAFYESRGGILVEKSELIVRRLDFPQNSITLEKVMLLALTLCWVVQVLRLVIRIQIGIG